MQVVDGNERGSRAARPWLTSYPEGCPADIEVPDTPLPDAFEEAAERWKKRPALIFYGRKIRYAELKDLVNRFACALHSLGVRKGDLVALFLLNCPQFVIAYLGCLKVGAVVVPVNALSGYASAEASDCRIPGPGPSFVRTSSLNLSRKRAHVSTASS